MEIRERIQKEAEEKYRRGEISSVQDYVLGALSIIDGESDVDSAIYYTSKLIPSLIFKDSDDKILFDLVLEDYCSDLRAMKEFENACNQYASLDAVQYHIDRCTFHRDLRGPFSLKLLDVATRVFSGTEYTISIVMCYVFNRYKKLKNDGK